MNADLRAGVFASDTLPKAIKKPCILICNTDPHYLPGTHWVAIYIAKNGSGCFFDSFGRPPDGNILLFLLRNTTRWNYNRKVIQDISSKLCGQYCLLFLLNFVMRGSLYDFFKLFDDNYKQNDVICATLFKLFFS